MSADFIEIISIFDECLKKRQTVLNLAFRGLTIIPFSLAGLSPFLRELCLNENNLVMVPDEIAQFDRLELLNLQSNKITLIPEALMISPSLIKSLEQVILSGNPLTSLPAGLENFIHLTKLWLDECHLSSLPENFHLLENLTHLSLETNQLSHLPADFGELTALRWLNLASNQLYELPESFKCLTQLSHLSLCSNAFDYIPESLISSLTSLTCLRFCANDLKAFPSDDMVVELAEISCIDLRGNANLPKDRPAHWECFTQILTGVHESNHHIPPPRRMVVSKS